jgi:hypothetical protein
MKNWSDEEILNYLMTSDFDENHSPEELKSLLLKFRLFYRISANRFTNIEFERKKYHQDIESLKIDYNNITQMKTDQFDLLLNKYNSILNRKLTLWERFTGRIQPKDNEIL